MQPRWSPRSATARPLPEGAISRPGSGWCRARTTGGKPRLLGITKRGNKYLRKLLIHGARAALPRLANSGTPLGEWLQALMRRTHKNAAVVALANKLARIAWAVLRREENFKITAAEAAL